MVVTTFIAVVRDIKVDGDDLNEVTLHSEHGTTTIEVGKLVLDDHDVSLLIDALHRGAAHTYSMRFRVEREVQP